MTPENTTAVSVGPQGLMEEAVQGGATVDQAFDEAVACGHDVALCHRAHMAISAKIRKENQDKEAA